jgi:hypothetical protein
MAETIITNTPWAGVAPDPRLGGADDLNPKDRLGMKKVPMTLLPAVGRILGAMAMADGARKYGPYNWRTKKVRMSIYLDAIERHLAALFDGEDFAPDSKVHHLGHVIACASIIADAASIGQLVDDRPTKGNAANALEAYARKLSGEEKGGFGVPPADKTG